MAGNISVDTDYGVLEYVFSYSVERRRDRKLDKATIKVADTTTARKLSSGDEITVERWGTPVFIGDVTARPTESGQNSIEFDALGKRRELSDHDVNRVAYEQPPDKVMESVAADRAVERDETTISTCDDVSNWSATGFATNYFRLGNFEMVKANNYGADVLWAGFKEGARGDYSIRFGSVPTSAAPTDGRFYTLYVRAIWNNSGDVFDADVELRDHGGTNYVWEDVRFGNGEFEKVALRPEDASSDGAELTTDGTFEVRISVDGELPDPRALALDYVGSVPYTLKARDMSVSVNVDNLDANRTLTRRLKGSVSQVIGDLSTEENLTVLSDGSSVKVTGNRPKSDYVIDYNTTPVIKANINRDYRDIANRVVVEGADGARAAVQDPESISFYDKVKTERYPDQSLQTNKDCHERAVAILEDKAWDDTTMEFTIADRTFGTGIDVGDSVRVIWSPDGIDNYFTVDAITHSPTGFPKLTFGGTTG